MEQSEHDVSMIERQYQQAPDEPYAGSRYAEARNCVADALDYLNDPDPEAALASLREAIGRIEAAL